MVGWPTAAIAWKTQGNMVSIFVNDEDKTKQIKDWKVWRDDRRGELALT